MAKKLILTTILMHLFSLAVLCLLSAVVYYNQLSAEVAEGGIMCCYLLTGIFGGRIYRYLQQEKNWKGAFSLAACYLLLFVFLSFGRFDLRFLGASCLLILGSLAGCML